MQHSGNQNIEIVKKQRQMYTLMTCITYVWYCYIPDSQLDIRPSQCDNDDSFQDLNTALNSSIHSTQVPDNLR